MCTSHPPQYRPPLQENLNNSGNNNNQNWVSRLLQCACFVCEGPKIVMCGNEVHIKEDSGASLMFHQDSLNNLVNSYTMDLIQHATQVCTLLLNGPVLKNKVARSKVRLYCRFCAFQPRFWSWDPQLPSSRTVTNVSSVPKLHFDFVIHCDLHVHILKGYDPLLIKVIWPYLMYDQLL